jgi:uncharacterized membrane protein (UPF0127 family)
MGRAVRSPRLTWISLALALALGALAVLAAAPAVARVVHLWQEEPPPAEQQEPSPHGQQEPAPVEHQDPPAEQLEPLPAEQQAPPPAEQEVPPPAESAPCGQQSYAEVDIETRPWLWLEVAATPEDRARGLMFRESMPWDTGMLFVFEQPSASGFWMRNTLLPLSIAWLDQYGTIVDIQDMQPLSDEVHAPPAPYVYAIETNQGWFEANGVGVGQRVVLCINPTGP